MQPILPPIPFYGCREIFRAHRDIFKSAKPLLVAAKCNMVLSSFFDAHTIIRMGLHGVKIEDEQQSCAFENEYFVIFIL